MRNWALAALAVLGLWASAAVAAPLETYGRLPNIEEMQVSPDGAMLGMIVTTEEGRILAVTRLADGSVIARAPVSKAKIRRLQWAGPGHLLVTMSKTTDLMEISDGRREWFVVIDLDLATGKVRNLLDQVDIKENHLNTIHGAPQVRTIKGRPVAFLAGYIFAGSRGVLTLFRADLETHQTRIVGSGDEFTRDWVVGEDGEVLAQESYRPNDGRWRLKLRKNARWLETGETMALLDAPSLEGLGREGLSVLVSKDDEEGYTQFHEVSLDGQWSKPLDVDNPEGFVHDPATGGLVGYAWRRGDESGYVFFDPRDQKLWKAISAAYPGDQVTLVSWTPDRTKLVVRVDSAVDGPFYDLVDVSTRRSRWLGNEYTALKSEDISPVKPVAFKAQDGLPLTGYLTLPRGAGKNLPLVVFPHGGPESRDSLASTGGRGPWPPADTRCCR